MKYIKLFIASSVVEFAQERLVLSDFIRTLNDIYICQDIYLELFICEDFSNAVAKERKQEEYNQQIRASQYFYIIFGKGSDCETDAVYTIEEFNVALKQFKKTGAPKIYTYFKRLPEGESAEKNVRAFMERLDKEIGHYYSMFVEVDAIKLNMLLELTRDHTIGGTVKLEDGVASLDGHEVLSVENIPLYSKNETVQKLRAEKARLEAETSRLALENVKNQDSDIMRRRHENAADRNRITEQLHALEMDVLNLLRQTVEKRSLGQNMNWRERDALKCIDEGRYGAAKELLEAPEWKNEVWQAGEIADAVQKRICEYFSGQKTLIDTYRAEGDTAENAKKIIAIYEDVFALAKERRMERDVLDMMYDYAVFLEHQRKYPKAITVTQWLKEWYEVEEHIGDAQRADLNNLQGTIYSEQKDPLKAEQAYREALKTYRKLERAKPGTYREGVAMCCNNLANLLCESRSWEKAESLHREALKLYRELEAEKPGTYQADVAMCCNNLARLLDKISPLKETEGLYREALDIYRKQAERDPETNLPYLAMCSGNLATHFENVGSSERAEELYCEALGFYRGLAEKNPAVYLPDVVKVRSALVGCLYEAGSREEAEKQYREALALSKALAQKEPDAGTPYVAGCCNDLAIILYQGNAWKEAEELLREALELYRELAEKEPDVYLKDVEKTYNSLSVLLDRSGSWGRARRMHLNAEKTRWKRMVRHPGLFLADTIKKDAADAVSFGALGELLKMMREDARKGYMALAEEDPELHLPNMEKPVQQMEKTAKSWQKRVQSMIQQILREIRMFWKKLFR